MAEAGADIVVCHLGLTTGGAIGAETALTLADCVPLIDAVGRGRAQAVRPDVIVLCHGGPIATPEDAALHPRRIARRATASTAPARWSGCRPRSALTETTRRFIQITRSDTGDRP